MAKTVPMHIKIPGSLLKHGLSKPALIRFYLQKVEERDLILLRDEIVKTNLVEDVKPISKPIRLSETTALEIIRLSKLTGFRKTDITMALLLIFWKERN